MRIVAVTSGKGGVGKTSFASALAVLLQTAGGRVLAIDADLGLADLNIALGVRPTYSLQDVVEGRVSMADAIVETPTGVHLLPACAGSFDLANLDPQTRMGLLHAIEALPTSYDTIVIDTGAGIGATAMSFAAAASEIIVVTTRELAAMADAYATMKVLTRRFGVKRVRLLVNMADTAADAQVVFETLEMMARRFLMLKVEFLGYVCRDPSVSRANRDGVPFVIARPTAPASHCMRVVAARLQPVARDATEFWKRVMSPAEVAP